ncbi:MAG: ribonuclease HII [Bacillota bacterium]|nr:ribonuclease HII [Bacillota bacterium]
MTKYTISIIEQKLADIQDVQDPFYKEIAEDERKGVQNLLNKWKRKKHHEELLERKFIEMNQYETKYRLKGYKYIAGIDEVGRGPLAGPVAAAAVILPENFYLPGIDDSKKLTEKKREEYDEIIRREAIAVSVVMIDAIEIDRINIYEATKVAMKTALSGLKCEPDFLLIDAMKLDTPYPNEAIIKGDAKSISIAAASIIAKTARDRFMKDISVNFPAYGFSRNMGYGTKEHLQAIEKHGITPYHRKSFAPVKDMIWE